MKIKHDVIRERITALRTYVRNIEMNLDDLNDEIDDMEMMLDEREREKESE